MFNLQASEVSKRVFFFTEIIGGKDFPVILLAQEDGTWKRQFVEDLPLERGERILVFKSRKTGLPYHWKLSEVLFSQYWGQIPEGFRVRQQAVGKYHPKNFFLVPLNINATVQPPALPTVPINSFPVTLQEG